MILEGLAAVLSGGATGLIGSLVTDVAEHFKAKSQQKHDQAMKRLDIEYLEAETKSAQLIAQSEIDRSKVEASAKIEQSEVEAFIQATKSDAEVLEAVANAKEASSLLNIAAFTRTMVRPLLTLYLCILTTVMYLDVSKTLESAEIKEVSAQTIEVYGETTANVLYLTSAAVMFWFGQRKKSNKT